MFKLQTQYTLNKRELKDISLSNSNIDYEEIIKDKVIRKNLDTAMFNFKLFNEGTLTKERYLKVTQEVKPESVLYSVTSIFLSEMEVDSLKSICDEMESGKSNGFIFNPEWQDKIKDILKIKHLL